MVNEASQAIYSAGKIYLQQSASAQRSTSAGGPETQNSVQGCITALRAVAEIWECAEQLASQLEATLQQQIGQHRLDM